MAYLQSMKKRWPILAGMAVFIVAGACMNAFGGLFIPPLALVLCVLGIWLPGRVLAEIAGAKRFGLLQTPWRCRTCPALRRSAREEKRRFRWLAGVWLLHWRWWAL